MADTDPVAFALYSQLLNTGNIPSKPAGAVTAAEHTSLCKLYILAYQLDDTVAQDAASDAIHNKSKELVEDMKDSLPSREHIEIIYNGTQEPNAARRLLVDLFAVHATTDMLQGTYSPESMSTLAMKLMELHGASVASAIAKSKEHYHHGAKVEQKKTKTTIRTGAGADKVIVLESRQAALTPQ